jgi:23S rRNA U2552 (ribose-2'-O)-methylase RlmE/FtsJ
MDFEKKIRMLVSENEFLLLQLEDVNLVLKKKDEEIDLLADDGETAAYLRSKIDSNLIEIEQLKYYVHQAGQKSLGLEILNEELEVDLLTQMKGRQKEQQSLKEMGSVKANLEVVTEELNEAASLYKMLQSLKEKLSEANSIASLNEIEICELKIEIAEQRELIELLKIKKIVN